MTTTIVTTHEELPGLLRALHVATRAGILAANVEAAAAGQRIVRAHVPVDTGELRRQTRAEVTGATTGTVAEIVEDTPYAAAQEAGTRPFTPPLGPLIEWAKRQAPNLGLDEHEVYPFARAVQMKIAREGIKAKWHTRDAQPELGKVLERFLRIQLNRLYR